MAPAYAGHPGGCNPATDDRGHGEAGLLRGYRGRRVLVFVLLLVECTTVRVLLVVEVEGAADTAAAVAGGAAAATSTAAIAAAFSS